MDTPAERPDPQLYLIADLEHFGESLWRNEETGEKRFNFLLALVTAVCGGLVTLHSGEILDTVPSTASQMPHWRVCCSLDGIE